MTVITETRTCSIEEYLEAEKHSSVKHEYVDGYIYAIVGASKVHNLITVNLASALRIHLRGSPCRVFVADIKVRAANNVYYPDVVVSCEGNGDPYVETTPRLIVEVLSDSTERIDRQEKRLAYQTLESLQEYILVSQDRIEVQIYRRSGDGWELEIYSTGDEINLASVALMIPIEQIFENVWP